MPRKGENIRKRKDGRWEGRYVKKRVNGKSVQGSVFGKTYSEVKEKLIRAKAAAAEAAKSQEQIQAEARNETFGEIAEEWYEASLPTLKISSAAKYRNILNKQLLPEFSSKKITEISREDISSFTTQLLLSGKKDKGYAPKTVTGILSVLKLIFAYANHVKCITVIDLRKITVKQTQKRLRVFSRFEQERINSYLLDDLNCVNLGILLCLYTGLRIGEICALTWEDISFSEKKIHINKTMQRVQLHDGSPQKTKVIISSPKSDSSNREIPIPNEIFRLLLVKRQPNNRFFLTAKERKYMEPRTLENHFNAIMKKCNISGATVHTCRHTFATRCVELGFDIKTLSEILGHASVTITMNRYVHPSMETKMRNMDKLSSLLDTTAAYPEETQRYIS